MSGRDHTILQITDSGAFSDADALVFQFATGVVVGLQAIYGILWMLFQLAYPSGSAAVIYSTMIGMSFIMMFLGIWIGYWIAGKFAPQIYVTAASGSGVFLIIMFCLSMYPSPIQIQLFVCCIVTVVLSVLLGHQIALEILA